MLDGIKKRDNLMYYSLLNFNISSFDLKINNPSKKENIIKTRNTSKQKDLANFFEMFKNFETNDKKFSILKEKMDRLSRIQMLMKKLF